MKTIFKVPAIVALILISIFLILSQTGLLDSMRRLIPKRTERIATEDIYPDVGYEPIDPRYQIFLVSSKLSSPTRVRITPDGTYLLVTQITGDVIALPKDPNGGFVDITQKVLSVETRFPGFPPEEGGLTSLVFSSDFSTSGRVFLLYNYKKSDKKIYNRVATSILKDVAGKLTGSKPTIIFEANIDGSHSHQITDGVSIDIEGTSHLLFAVGEGFKPERALDPKLEAGKILLIAYDGSDPKGVRPYPQNKKVEAIGIRNAYVLTQNPSDPLNRVIIADTGPNKYDRLIMAKLGTGTKLKSYNFGWNGNQDKLTDPIPDPNIKNVADVVITRLPETRTFTGLSFDKDGNLLATLFGQTGSKDNVPGKEIWLGKLTNLLGQPTVSFTPIIRRKKAADNKLSNPIGLAIDPVSDNYYFADILEGRIYRVSKEKNAP